MNQSKSEQTSRSIIQAFHVLLNQPDLVPRHCYRRNKVSYTLVSYLNNTVGLFLSDNYESIPTFISRAAKHMQEFAPQQCDEQYYDLAFKYISHLTSYLTEYTSVNPSDSVLDIPAAILQAGSQVVPNYAIKGTSVETLDSSEPSSGASVPYFGC
jgi:hypothetical protein